jgi:hypothetical protein
LISKLANIELDDKQKILEKCHELMPVVSTAGYITSNYEFIKTYEELQDTTVIDVIKALTYNEISK